MYRFSRKNNNKDLVIMYVIELLSMCNLAFQSTFSCHLSYHPSCLCLSYLCPFLSLSLSLSFFLSFSSSSSGSASCNTCHLMIGLRGFSSTSFQCLNPGLYSLDWFHPSIIFPIGSP